MTVSSGAGSSDRDRHTHTASHPPDDAGPVAAFRGLAAAGGLAGKASCMRPRRTGPRFGQGKRYMSNITVAENANELAALPLLDVLATPLSNSHTASGVFTGTYAGPGRGAVEQDFARNLARISTSAPTRHACPACRSRRR